jgi:hypothetical protein
MKEINIDGRVLKYQLMGDEEWEWTEFYEGTEIVTKRVKSGWCDILKIFGTTVQIEVPKLAFKINMSCTDNRTTKKEWKVKILKELDLLNRKEELEKGEPI